MLVAVIYIAAAIGVAVYMLAALLRPLMRRLPDMTLAADVERRYPVLRERLLTTLDLSHFLPGRRTKIFVSLDHDIFHPSQPLPSDPSDFIETLDDLVELGFAQVGFTDESWQFLLVLCAEMKVVFELKRIFEEEKDVKSVILVIDREGRRLKGLEIVWGWEWIG